MHPARWLTRAALFAALATAACAARTPAPEPRPMGAAKRALEIRQTQNLDSSSQASSAEGTGATTAAGIIENYHTNQKTDVQERRQDRQRDRGISEAGQND